ncbi:MAG: hypothetical protein N4A45_00190 [Flavobacteriales bacterium]|jgi:hypothetical protein|nr:hypothetical protein [Flavobacteriales bacterium]
MKQNIQLAKNRDTGAYITDAFNFFFQEIKGLSIGFITICIVPLIFAMAGMYLIVTDLININLNDLENFTDYLSGTGLLGIVLTMLGYMIFSLFYIFFVPVYMKLYYQKSSSPSGREVWDELKSNMTAILVYAFLSLILLTPFYVVVAIASVISLITIVGIFIVITFVMNWVALSWFEYINMDTPSYFKAFGLAWDKHIKSNFWHKLFAGLLIMIILYIVQFMLNNVVMIPLSGSFDFFQDPEIMGDPEEIMDAFGAVLSDKALLLLFVPLYIISTILQTLVGLVYYVLVGLIYFTGEVENGTLSEGGTDEMDQIGTFQR